MRYRYRYNYGPLYMDRPFATGQGLVASVFGVAWYIVAFLAQLVVWAVLLAVGLIYTLVWLIVWPFARLLS